MGRFKQKLTVQISGVFFEAQKGDDESVIGRIFGQKNSSVA